MNYNKLQSLLPNDELHYISDSTQFFIDNKINPSENYIFENNNLFIDIKNLNYKKLFYDNVLADDSITGTSENKKQTTPLFNPETEEFKSYLHET